MRKRSVRAAGAPPARLGVRLLSKREILAITNVTFPDHLGVDAGRNVPALASVRRQVDVVVDRGRAWLATLPVRKLKGDAPEALDNESPWSAS